MIKCPNCGSTAQVKLIDYESQFFEVNNKFYVYATYRCGCGRGFVTEIPSDMNNEVLYDDEI